MGSRYFFITWSRKKSFLSVWQLLNYHTRPIIRLAAAAAVATHTIAENAYIIAHIRVYDENRYNIIIKLFIYARYKQTV